MNPPSPEKFALVRENARVRLLEAAMNVFAVKGYHASSMALIAKAAKVSKGLTYHYFESKAALLIALVEKRLQEWLPLVEGLESIQDPIRRLHFLIDFVLGELVEDTQKLRFYNSLYLNADGVRAIEQAMKKYHGQFERLFQAERKLYSDLGFSDADMEATFLRSQLQGICLEYMLGPKDYPLDKIKKRLLDRYRNTHMQYPIEIVQVEQGRYQFYREHKYVSFVLNELERLIAKTDFRVPVQVKKIEQEFDAMVQMLRGHAQYEDLRLHPLLQEKGSAIFQEAEGDHQRHENLFQTLRLLLDQIKATTDEQLRVGLGYQFYLNYRKFVGENLHHLHEEETQILPELQRLYSDAQLRTVEAETYQRMTIPELIHMLQVLFPHFNPSDREAFLSDIQDAAPEKFIQAWEVINEIIDPDEQKRLSEKLRI